MTDNRWTRRDVLLAASGAGLLPGLSAGQEHVMLHRPIPSSGEMLPVIGLGTYDVFDVASTADAIATRKDIVDLLLDAGGSVIDTSPMYNRSERVIGDVIAAGSPRPDLFIATKVWTDGEQAGSEQMHRSAQLMNVDVIDLMQVHNLRDTAVHMRSINAMQENGFIRYSGLTHYRKDAHAALEAEMIRYRPDFIQINYSLGEPEADQRLLPLARDMGIAVLANRPYQAGALFRRVAGREVPDWAEDFAASWGQFFLKFIVSHPAVTCVIPATSKPHHMIDNLAAGYGPLPDAAMRERMAAYLDSL